jgi:peptidoglycan/LPS O-acetylase OafA/YrhL
VRMSTGAQERLQRALVGIIAAILLLAVAPASAAPHIGSAQSAASTHQGQSRLSREFAVSPLVNAKVQEFVASKNDLKRSAVLARVVVPLIVLLLIAGELLAAGARPGARPLRAFAVPLIALFVVLAVVRLHAYA